MNCTVILGWSVLLAGLLAGCGGPAANPSATGTPPQAKAAAPKAQASAPPADTASAGPGSVKGKVKYSGAPPEPKLREVPEASQADCKCKQIESQDLVVDKASQGLKWAIVRIEGLIVPPPAKPFPQAEIDQKSCQFVPRVVVSAPGADLRILNSEGVAHNIRGTALDNTGYPSRLMAADEKELIVKGGKYLATPEVVKFNCDMHDWMKCFVVVHDPRFAAITGADGAFEIKEIPAGKHKLTVYHDEFGLRVLHQGKETLEIEIEVQAGQALDLGEIAFKGRSN